MTTPRRIHTDFVRVTVRLPKSQVDWMLRRKRGAIGLSINHQLRVLLAEAQDAERRTTP